MLDQSCFLIPHAVFGARTAVRYFGIVAGNLTQFSLRSVNEGRLSNRPRSLFSSSESGSSILGAAAARSIWWWPGPSGGSSSKARTLSRARRGSCSRGPQWVVSCPWNPAFAPSAIRSQSGSSTTFPRFGARRPECAMERNSAARYSITSSARARSVGGTVMPSAFAVLRLMASVNLVGCMIGRSPGFSPLRMRPT